MSDTRRTCSPITRAASYSDGAIASPRPASKSRRSSVTTDCVSDRLPLASSTNTRSPGCSNTCILRQTLTWSYPALVRESEAITRPYLVTIPRQYVMTIPSAARQFPRFPLLRGRGGGSVRPKHARPHPPAIDAIGFSRRRNQAHGPVGACEADFLVAAAVGGRV